MYQTSDTHYVIMGPASIPDNILIRAHKTVVGTEARRYTRSHEHGTGNREPGVMTGGHLKLVSYKEKEQ